MKGMGWSQKIPMSSDPVTPLPERSLANEAYQQAFQEQLRSSQIENAVRTLHSAGLHAIEEGTRFVVFVDPTAKVSRNEIIRKDTQGTSAQRYRIILDGRELAFDLPAGIEARFRPNTLIK